MCGEAGADETHCLDSCNGYETFLPNIDDFKYRYYMVSIEIALNESEELWARMCTSFVGIVVPMNVNVHHSGILLS